MEEAITQDGTQAHSALYVSAVEKLREGAYRFDRARNPELMKTLECAELDRELFRATLRVSMQCKLNVAEMDTLMEEIGENGYIHGPKFLLLFYKLRSQKRDLILKKRIADEKNQKEVLKHRYTKKEEALEEKSRLVLAESFSEDDKNSALQKVTEAAVDGCIRS